MAVNDYNTDPDLNTSISGINIAEGCAPSGINNAIRQLMADVKTESGAQTAAIAAAKSAAISTASADATSKADAAQAAAEATAATALSAAVTTLNNKNTSQDTAIAAAQATADAALPMAGGRMTGTLSFTTDNAIYRSNHSNKLIISGGYGWSQGGCIQLIGRDASADAGEVWIRAVNDEGWADLVLYPNRTLTLSGYPVLTSAGGTLCGSITYTSGGITNTSHAGNLAFSCSGGTDNGTGYLTLYGKDNVNGSLAVLGASSGDGTLARLKVTPTTLTWQDQPVLTLVASWRSGNNWYRKYSDGWIEQGGVVSVSHNTLATVTCHTAFTSSSYTVLCGLVTNSGQFGDDVTCNVQSRTTTSFTVFPFDAGENTGTADMCWYACGY